MMNRIGIRHEDKYKLERRAPLIPDDIADLIVKHGISFEIERSEKRIFKDSEYGAAGAELSSNLDQCDIIMGVKEMPKEAFKKDRVYIFFSHVIKGQPYNMPMLQKLIDSGSTLIDYERIADEQGKRLIFFGRYAGIAGMINTLWAAGQRYKALGIENPFSQLKQAYRYHSLNEARQDILSVSQRIRNNGLPAQMTPLVIAISGDGNVSKGAMEMIELLDGIFITPGRLKAGDYPSDAPLVFVNIIPQDYLTHEKGHDFELDDYIKNPDRYISNIEELLPQVHVFVNGIYWDERYPKLIKKEWLQKQKSKNKLNLRIIGDITCDVHGSVECTEMATEIEDPVFIYDPSTDQFQMGFEGEGIAVMAVDILPSELPREASAHFSTALKPFIQSIATADFSLPFDKIDLPLALKRAVIVYRGSLTNEYEYLEQYLNGN